MSTTHTKGQWTVTPFLTPDKDDDPMMVYHVEGGDLQERFDNLQTDENGDYNQDEVDAIHAENAANAKLIEDAFTVASETGKTPWQLAEENRALLDTLKMIARLQTEEECGEDIPQSEDWVSTLSDIIITTRKVIAKAEGRD